MLKLKMIWYKHVDMIQSQKAFFHTNFFWRLYFDVKMHHSPLWLCVPGEIVYLFILFTRGFKRFSWLTADVVFMKKLGGDLSNCREVISIMSYHISILFIESLYRWPVRWSSMGQTFFPWDVLYIKTDDLEVLYLKSLSLRLTTWIPTFPLIAQHPHVKVWFCMENC